MSIAPKFKQERKQKHEPKSIETVKSFLIQLGHEITREIVWGQKLQDALGFDLEFKYHDNLYKVEIERKDVWQQGAECEDTFAVVTKRGTLYRCNTIQFPKRKLMKLIAGNRYSLSREHQADYFFMVNHQFDRLLFVTREDILNAVSIERMAAVDEEVGEFEFVQVPCDKASFYRKINDIWVKDTVNGRYRNQASRREDTAKGLDQVSASAT